MLPISQADIELRIQRDNPWWAQAGRNILEADYPRRVYFGPFKSLALNFEVRRATILLGPRRVGKTVIIKQMIHEAIESGFNPRRILYASIDAPVYSGISLEHFLGFMPSLSDKEQFIIIFDEIQYLKGWENHLKDLVDSYPNIKFIATGSAAAALKLKSQESGAGRFSEFLLPPLTFYEFLCFIKKDNHLVNFADNKYIINDIDALNESFIDYLNFGGYPEAVLNPIIRENQEQFIKNDIIDKVLLKDLPSLYGIQDIQQLNKLFSFLAYNAGNEANLENISQGSGLAKPTIKKYIEYLESAFLIIKVPTVDDNCRRLARERNFKIYLNNPSMRAAIFAPVERDNSTLIGHLAESAVFSQWQHAASFRQLRYARWRNEGEVDIVFLATENDRPIWVGEIKWSDRVNQHPMAEMRHMRHFIGKHPSTKYAIFTTKSTFNTFNLDDHEVSSYPTAAYCYAVGRNITASFEQITLSQAVVKPRRGRPKKTRAA